MRMYGAWGEGGDVGMVVSRLHLDMMIEMSLVSINYQFSCYSFAGGKIRTSSQADSSHRPLDEWN